MTGELNKSMDSRQHGNDNKSRLAEESPPILKRWSRLYMIVMINLVLCLLTFYLIRRIFE